MAVHPKGDRYVIDDCFFDIKEAITDIFLPALYGGEYLGKDYSYRHNLSTLPIQHAGLAISRNPSTTSEEIYEASTANSVFPPPSSLQRSHKFQLHWPQVGLDCGHG
jgi:hypothetical protein